MNKVIYFLSIVFVLASCGNTENKTGFSIKGKINNYTDKSITLSELTPKGLVFLDTASVSPEGNFELTGNVSEKTFCIINLPKGNIVLVVDSTTDITLSLNADDVENYTLVGSPESETLRKLLQINNTYIQKVQALETKYSQYQNDVPPLKVQEQIRAEYDSLMSSRAKELQQYVLSNTNSIVPYFATNYLMPESDFTSLAEIDQKLYNQYKHSKYAQEHHARVEKLRKTAEGESAPDIVMADPYGKTIALSSLRGKYVLVDFWASWCRPCRAESPRLVKLFNKYKSFGFEIFSVSLDDNREAWTKAINDDRLLWTHVSDLKKWNSDVVSVYNIQGIPFTVLLNKEGKIIAKDLRGEALEKKVEEAIKQGL